MSYQYTTNSSESNTASSNANKNTYYTNIGYNKTNSADILFPSVNTSSIEQHNLYEKPATNTYNNFFDEKSSDEYNKLLITNWSNEPSYFQRVSNVQAGGNTIATTTDAILDSNNFATAIAPIPESPASSYKSDNLVSTPTSPEIDISLMKGNNNKQPMASYYFDKELFKNTYMDPQEFANDVKKNNALNSEAARPLLASPTTSITSSSSGVSAKTGATKAKRSRMGCLTCRHRKKRCCETKPRCHECSRLGLKCTWPTPGLERRNKPKHSRENENMYYDEYFGNIQIIRGIVESRTTEFD